MLVELLVPLPRHQTAIDNRATGGWTIYTLIILGEEHLTVGWRHSVNCATSVIGETHSTGGWINFANYAILILILDVHSFVLRIYKSSFDKYIDITLGGEAATKLKRSVFIVCEWMRMSNRVERHSIVLSL